jgi:hypothetical protein
MAKNTGQISQKKAEASSLRRIIFEIANLRCGMWDVYSANAMIKATDAISYLNVEDGSSERTTFTIPDSSET